jgi:erythromycin esterase-like protein
MLKTIRKFKIKSFKKMSENKTSLKLNEKQIIADNVSLLIDGVTDYKLFDEEFRNASIVLIGEASHGSSEFYRIRAKITQKLITDYSFNAVAIEGDWPDVYQINRYVQGFSPKITLNKAMSSFKRFPLWMWRNEPMLEFVKWLKIHNDKSSYDQKAGIYGLDLYSLHSSIEEIIKFLDKEDPKAAAKARDRYKCLDTAIHEPQMYGFLSRMDLKNSCANAVTQQLVELNQKAASRFIQQDKRVEEDEYFQIIQNAHLIKSAESYYRNMFKEEVSTWNLRDKHMFDTLQNIQSYLSKKVSKQVKLLI